MSRTSGTYSLPLDPVVTGTAVSSTWANTTMSDIATEITASVPRDGTGAMSAALPLYAGTVSLPGLTFSSDTDTGLYRIGANNPGMAAGGNKIQEWSTLLSTLTVPLKVSMTNPAATTGYTNTVTSGHICKAWGVVTTGGSLALTAGLNIASVSASGADVTVNIADDMADANYAVVGGVTIAGGSTANLSVGFHSHAVGLFKFKVFDTSNAVYTDLAVTSAVVRFVVFGLQ